jgi:cytochrome P450
MSDPSASFLAQYDALPAEAIQQKVQLVGYWIQTAWRAFSKELRENRPIFVTPAFTIATLYDDVVEILSRETVFSVRLYAPKMDPVVSGPFMLARDATPVNWREKGIMQAMLRPEELPYVREMSGNIADESLDRSAPDGTIEVVSRLGRAVPVRICGDYFGFPGPDQETMYRWSRATQADMFKNLQNDPAIHAASVQAGNEMMAYLADLLAQKRQAQQPETASPNGGVPVAADIFSRLVQTQFPHELGFDDHRLLTNVAGLLIGSVETASQAIVQALEQLLLRPDTAAAASAAAGDADPSRFDGYPWEALRFNPMNPLQVRYCEQDYLLAAGTARATQIQAGTVVFAGTGSAMFDPAAFPDPESFLPDRPQYNQLHFGYGHHACLGRQIGQVQIPEVIRRVLRRRNVRLLPPPDGTIDFKGGPFPERFVVAYDG